MPHEVIMPALGMAQETGVLVSWLKRSGDAVRAGEPLMEVETDKAVMEVEAQASGWLTDVRAAAGDAVPVGAVIARIAQAKPDAPQAPPGPQAAAKQAEQLAPVAAPVADPVAAPVAAPAAAPPPVATTPANGRIFASPKARRLAAEAGLDLRHLAQAGHPQPYHVADLAALRALSAASGAAPCQIVARVPAAAVAGFVALMQAETGAPPPPGALAAGFACAALREALAAGDAALTLALDRPGAPRRLLTDPDRARFAAQPEAAAGAAPALILRDLSGGPFQHLRLGSDTGAAPVLSVAEQDGAFTLTLDYAPAQLSDEAAIALVAGLAARLAEPLRHLL